MTVYTAAVSTQQPCTEHAERHRPWPVSTLAKECEPERTHLWAGGQGPRAPRPAERSADITRGAAQDKVTTENLEAGCPWRAAKHCKYLTGQSRS